MKLNANHGLHRKCREMNKVVARRCGYTVFVGVEPNDRLRDLATAGEPYTNACSVYALHWQV